MVTLEPTTEEGRIYECAILYGHPLTQKEEQDIQKEVEKHFADVGAKQMAKDVWGRRGLAYKIGGYEDGVYVIYYYEIDPKKIKELDEALRITPGVLRHIIIKPPKGYEVVNYSETYEQWLKDREQEVEEKEKEREEALKQKVVQRAKRQAKKVEKEKVVTEEKAEPVEEKKITEGIEKLISDEDFDL